MTCIATWRITYYRWRCCSPSPDDSLACLIYWKKNKVSALFAHFEHGLLHFDEAYVHLAHRRHMCDTISLVISPLILWPSGIPYGNWIRSRGDDTHHSSLHCWLLSLSKQGVGKHVLRPSPSMQWYVLSNLVGSPNLEHWRIITPQSWVEHISVYGRSVRALW